MTTLCFLFTQPARAQDHSANHQQVVSKLSADINTEHDDLAPYRYGDKFYFTTVAGHEKKTNEVRRIFSGVPAVSSIQPIKENPRAGDVHAGHLTLMPDASKMYYTICKDETVDGQERCTIWSRQRNYEGDWQPASKLPPTVNLRGSTATQPSVGWDQERRRFVLYFVSNRPGGAGGMDIWCSVIERDGSYGEPYPLPFNTAKDEVSPFYYMPDKTLYFSSNGLGGYGGQDVFFAERKTGDDWTKPQNAGEVINSAYDEIHYTYHTYSQEGYFSSNRPESGEGFDIYMVKKQMNLQLEAFDIHNNTPITNVVAEVFSEQDGETRIYRQRPMDTHIPVHLEQGTSYRIVIHAEGFSSSTRIIDTRDMKAPAVRKETLLLFSDGPLAERAAPGKKHPDQLTGEDGTALPAALKVDLRPDGLEAPNGAQKAKATGSSHESPF